MKFTKITKKESFEIINGATMVHLTYITDFAKSLLGAPKLKGKLAYIEHFQKLIEDKEFKIAFYEKLCATKESKELYDTLLWKEKIISKEEVKKRFGLDCENPTRASYDYGMDRLDGVYKLIHVTNSNHRDNGIFLHERMRPILKLLVPLPEDYDIKSIEKPEDVKYTYSNEQGVLSFIPVIDDMLKNNIVAFGKTAEKPLAKTLNSLKTATFINEFFITKPNDSLSTDMLTRSFSFYRWEKKAKSKINQQDTIKDFLALQLEDKFNYSIIRTFTTHLKKVRYGYYRDGQKELFNIAKIILDNIPKNSWASFANIINFCKYNDFRFDLEAPYKTEDYYIEVDEGKGKYSWENRIYCDSSNYNALFFEPVLKAMFFYLASLGIVELKYNDPISDYATKPKNKEYISVWDSLKYIRFTNLGLYIFGYKKSYETPKLNLKKSELKFDQYRPIVTIDDSDAIMMAKIESYVEKYDKNKYILSYSKIFKNCSSYKTLEIKIDNFYNNIEAKPPKVINDFFDKIKTRSQLIKKESQKIVLVLNNDKELLNLLMTNEKLQELIIKANGYRIIIDKEDLSQLTKIVKENGFFVEF